MISFAVKEVVIQWTEWQGRPSKSGTVWIVIFFHLVEGRSNPSDMIDPLHTNVNVDQGIDSQPSKKNLCFL